MPRDVLIVEDKRDELDTYANSIRIRLNIEPFRAEDPSQALEILQSFTIKVLVTDFDLESSLDGIALVKKVQDELNLNIPCIMMTAHVDKIRVGEAVRRFFLFIDKADVSKKLTDAIRSAMDKYDLDEQYRVAFPVQRILAEQRSYLQLKRRVALKLTRITNIDKTYVREDDWDTYENAFQNINQAYEKKIRRKVSFVQSYGEASTISQTLNLSAGKLLTEIKSATEGKVVIESKTEEARELEVEATQRIEVTALSGTPDAEGRVLQSREYQAAPVYVRVDGTVESECNSCQIAKRDDATFLIPTSRIALRQVEHFDRGPDRITYTGFLGGAMMKSQQPVTQ